MPLPMMEFTINATRLQRPMARTRLVCGSSFSSGSFVSPVSPYQPRFSIDHFQTKGGKPACCSIRSANACE